jgi:hypothetical protein
MMEIVRRGANRFEFIDISENRSIRADSIGVLRVNGNAPLWWIVAEEYSEVWTAKGSQEILGAAADQARAAIESLRVTSSSSRTLSRITYGEVPDGFRQMTPESGLPPQLERGVRYVLHFLGSDVAAFEFDF